MKLSWSGVCLKTINYNLGSDQESTATVDLLKRQDVEVPAQITPTESYLLSKSNSSSPVHTLASNQPSRSLGDLEVKENHRTIEISKPIEQPSPCSNGSVVLDDNNLPSDKPTCSSTPEVTPTKKRTVGLRNTSNYQSTGSLPSVKTRLIEEPGECTSKAIEKCKNGGKISRSSSATSLPLSCSRNDDDSHRSSLEGSVTSLTSSSQFTTSFAETPTGAAVISYKASSNKLHLQLPETFSGNMDKSNKSIRKKKRSPSWYNVLSPSYKQKNDTYHKYFKDLPESERLLVDCSCALMKDILVQGRMYISQNYVCFNSNFLKWQKAITIKFKDIEQITKEKTAMIIPNAIQFQIKGRDKAPTFTSFTHRDRTFQQICRLWKNALADKPMTPQELWGYVHSQYGTDLGCSSDEDYVRPDISTKESKSKRKKKHSVSPTHSNLASLGLSSTGQNMDKSRKCDQSSEESKFSSQGSTVELSEDKSSVDDNHRTDAACIPNEEPIEHAKEDLHHTYLERQFPVPVDELFRTIFDEDCQFWKGYLEGKKCHDMKFESWRLGGEDYDGNEVRNLSYNLPLTNPLVPKSSHVEEVQVLYKESQQDRCYAVDCVARTYGVPYSDYFSTIMRYAMKKINPSTCELKVTAQVKFHKNPWGLVKNFIVKNVHSGMEENFELLERKLITYFSRARRPTTLPSLERARAASQSSVNGKNLYATGGATSSLLTDTAEQDFLPEKTMNAAPSVDSVAVPSDVNNNRATGLKFPQRQTETASGKWLRPFIAIIFILLLWNYSMYCRINTLEKVHSNSATEGDDLTCGFNRVFGANVDSDESVATSLRRLQQRLASLEKHVRNFTITSDRHWMTINGEWKELQRTVINFLSHIEAKDAT